jgi:hypothetical protein
MILKERHKVYLQLQKLKNASQKKIINPPLSFEKITQSNSNFEKEI